MPNVRDVLNSPEYKNFDIRKALAVEIREWVIPVGNSEEKGIRMLVFVIPKNQSEKRIQDDISVDNKPKVESPNNP